MTLYWDKWIEERDEWVAHNFPSRHIPDPGESIMGVIEELGELTHAELKMAQSIRGSSEEHIAAAQDAIGDMTVYLMGVMSYACYTPKLKTPGDFGSVFGLSYSVGRMAALYASSQSTRPDPYHNTPGYSTWIAQIAMGLKQFCDKRGWDYDSIVEQTWNQVKQRDWIVDPTTGGENDIGADVHPGHPEVGGDAA